MHRRASGIMCLPMRHEAVADNIAAIRDAIAEFGHVRLVDTGLTTTQQFHTLVHTLVGGERGLMQYKGGTNDRKDVSDGLGVLNTGTEPAHLRLTEHNELCYMDRWPRLFAIGCYSLTCPDYVDRADTGTTTFTDNVAATAYIREKHPKLYDRIMTHGCINSRLLPDKTTLSKRTGAKFTTWQASFLMDDRADVERVIREASMGLEWFDDGLGGKTLQMMVHRPGFVHVPDARTPDEAPVMWHNMWSNNTWFKDWSPYDKMPREEWPMHNFWGDGEKVTEEELQAFQDATWEGGRLWIEPWRTGELMLVDNHRVGHGRLRQHAEVERKMAVLLADPVSRVDPKQRDGVASGVFNNETGIPYRTA